MPREIRLMGYGVASRMTQQPKIGPDGLVEQDEMGIPMMISILELVFIDQRNGDVVILPLTEEGVAAVKKAISPTSLIVPPPGTRL